MRERLGAIVLEAIRLTNRSRPPDQQLVVDLDSPLFGSGSPLDSLGLVALVIDLEDALRDAGIEVDLSTAQAMSASRSPFRTPSALVEHIVTLLPHGR
jgi:acyl carrier protein